MLRNCALKPNAGCVATVGLSQPPPEGMSRVKQSWETPYVVTMVTAFIVVSIGLTFKPDTTINTWAKTEALRRKKAGEI